MFHKTLKSYHNNSPWDDREEHPDGWLWLLTKDELETLPKGIKLESTDGKEAVIGKDYIDTDERYGYIAYGIRGY